MSEGKFINQQHGSRVVRPLLATLLAGGLLVASLFAVPSFSSNLEQEGQPMTTLPQPITEFFESSNRGDATGVVACFTPTAVLDDWGRHFEGHAGVASWDRTDNTGVQAHIEPVGAKIVGDMIVVTVKVSGNGFNGTGHMHFELHGDKIAKLDIK